MIKDATIKIISTQSDGTDKNTIELALQGTYEDIGNGFRLVYMQSPEENENIKTVFTVKGSLVNINREGSYTADMVIQKGRRHICRYSTPVGEMLLGTYGEELEMRSDGLLFSYTIDVNSALLSRNKVEIKYTFNQE